jgi:hypothetical protein
MPRNNICGALKTPESMNVTLCFGLCSSCGFLKCYIIIIIIIVVVAVVVVVVI